MHDGAFFPKYIDSEKKLLEQRGIWPSDQHSDRIRGSMVFEASDHISYLPSSARRNFLPQ